MYAKDKMSHEDKAKVLRWAAVTGVIMTAFGWTQIALSETGETPLVPTTMTIVALSILLSNKQYDEFQRSLAYAGAVGGMLAITSWTAFVPIIADMLEPQTHPFWNATSDPRFSFYIAATGFFIGYYWKRLRGVA